MIVIGADTHKRSHTGAAVDVVTGRLLDEQTTAARRRSFDALLIWARGHDGERVWAIEDCRHVSGGSSGSCSRAAKRSCASRPS